jgi:hypothetical protein
MQLNGSKASKLTLPMLGGNAIVRSRGVLSAYF